jgi:hypothetical protein
MTNEIERKFLVKEIPAGLMNYPSNEISQGYLAVTDDAEIRIRKKGNKYFETVKSGKGLKRKEIEVEIGEKAFRSLWPLTEGMRVETRMIPYGLLIELSYFRPAAGLPSRSGVRSEEESARRPRMAGRRSLDVSTEQESGSLRSRRLTPAEIFGRRILIIPLDTRSF